MNAETILTAGQRVREQLPRGIRGVLLSALFVWILSAGPAVAEGTAPDTTTWKVTVGAGMALLPEYPGSDESHVHPFPMINVSYGNFFIGNQGAGLAGIGMHLYHDSRWTVGAAIGPDLVKPRTESDDPRLQGLGDIPRTVRAGLMATYRHEWLTVRAGVSSDINHEDQGTLVLVETLARYAPSKRLTMYAGPGVTWASGQYTRTFFGIDAAQSARSGLAEFHPDAGINRVQLSAGFMYHIDQHWGFGVNATAGRLTGDAAASAITEATSQNTLALFTAYRF